MKKIKPRITSIIKKIKSKWKWLLVILVVIAGFIWYQSGKDTNKVELTFQKPTRGNLIQTIEVSGVVDAKEKARLRFLAGGKLTYLGAMEGDWVKKWQTIASIDKATLQKQLQQDLNLYMKERWDWEQTQDDIEDRWIPMDEQRTVDKEQWDLENTVLTVEIRDIAIRNSAIYAPFEGILTVSPTSTTGVQLLSTDYFEVVNPNTLVFKAAVDESDIAQIKLGQTAELELDSYPDNILTTSVNYISYTSSQASSGTVFLVEFPINSNDLNRYRIGMNGDIAIITNTKENALYIPIEALIERDDKQYVEVKTGEETYEEREIQIGLETDDYIEVVSGVDENSEILIPD